MFVLKKRDTRIIFDIVYKWSFVKIKKDIVIGMLQYLSMKEYDQGILNSFGLNILNRRFFASLEW